MATLSWPAWARRTALAACLLVPLGLLSSASAVAQKMTLHIAHNATTDDTIHLSLLRFADQVKAATSGDITIVVHPNSELAGLRDGVEGTRLGTIDLTAADSGTLGNWIPAMGVFSLPFMFRDFAHANKVMDGPVGAWKARELREKMGLVLLGQASTGFRVILTTKVPVNNAESLKGVKLRVPEIPVYVATFRALQANPTPIPWGDVYTALQTGVVEGVEAPPIALYTIKLQEVTKYASLTNHIMQDYNLVMNAKKFDALPPATQEIFRKAGSDAAAWLRSQREDNDREYWTKLAETLKVNAHPDMTSFREKVKPVWEDFIKQTGTADVVQQISAALN
jgi:tripartite ATP-independent transporter DctP family solute receptor